MSDTLYDVLGIPEDAPTGDIKRAYRRQARAVHPDANPGASNGHDAFRYLTQAYETLSDPTRRAAYDQALVMERAAPQASSRRDDAHSTSTGPGPGDDHTNAWTDHTAWAPSGAAGNMGFGEEEPGEPADTGGQDDWTSTSAWDIPDDEDPLNEADLNFDDLDDIGDYDTDDLVDDVGIDEVIDLDQGWGEPDDSVRDDSWDSGSWGDDPWADGEDLEHDPWGSDTTGAGRRLKPAGHRASTVDRLTQVIWTAPAAWIAVTLLDGPPLRAVGDIWRWLQGSTGGAAVGSESTRLWGDLIRSTARTLLAVAVVTAVWLIVGAIVRIQNARLPGEPRWWRSPGWDGKARLLRAAVWVVGAWFLTAILLLPSVHEHIQAYDAAVRLHESSQYLPGATQEAPLDEYQAAETEATAGRWRVAVWALTLVTTWVVTSRLPGWLGMPSRYDRWLFGELTLSA